MNYKHKVQNAYELVLKDIIESDIDLFIGKFDAKNGDKHYMYGIHTVLSFIAYKVGEQQGDNFDRFFIQNLVNSDTERKNK